MMTTMAALLGGIPLAIGGGTGSELRTPLGITIVGGLLFSQMLTLFTTPVIYLAMDRFTNRNRRALATGVARWSDPARSGRVAGPPEPSRFRLFRERPKPFAGSSTSRLTSSVGVKLRAYGESRASHKDTARCSCTAA